MDDIRETFTDYMTYLKNEQNIKDGIGEETRNLEKFVWMQHAEFEKVHGNVNQKVPIVIQLAINEYFHYYFVLCYVKTLNYLSSILIYIVFQSMEEICKNLLKEVEKASEYYVKLENLIPAGEFFRYNFMFRSQTQKLVEVIAMLIFLLDDR